MAEVLDLPIVDKVYPVVDPSGTPLGDIYLIRDRAHPSVSRWKSVRASGRALGWAATRSKALALFGAAEVD